LPPIRFSQRRDQRHVEGFVLRLLIAGLVAFGQDHLPTVEPIDFDRNRYDHGLSLSSYRRLSGQRRD
jgi:hypothetical protein